MSRCSQKIEPPKVPLSNTISSANRINMSFVAPAVIAAHVAAPNAPDPANDSGRERYVHEKRWFALILPLLYNLIIC